MAITAYFIKQSKRRNSTLQFALTGASEFACTLKAPTSLDRPTFLLSHPTTFDFNLAYFDGKFYFVDDVVSVRDGQWEVSCVIDVLATYKTEITSGDFFVAFASDSSLYDSDLPDTRIPIKTDVVINQKTVNTYFTPALGKYMLTVNGENGCRIYACDSSDIDSLLSAISSWGSSEVVQYQTEDATGASYNWTSTENAIESLSKMINQSSFFGNSYADAPNNIRSCVFIPYSPSSLSGAKEHIYLGRYDTGVEAKYLTSNHDSYTQEIEIPGNLTAWEKDVNRTITLYLPFVGICDLPANSLHGYTKLSVKYIISLTDGSLCYEVYAGGSSDVNRRLIGTYTGCCGATVALGYSQTVAPNQVISTAYNGIKDAVTALINTSVSPVSTVAGIAGAGLIGLETSYELANVQRTYANGTIGVFSGFTCEDIRTDFVLNVVERHLTQTQAQFALAMGYPVQKYLPSLSGISGYVQCSNAHAEINGNAEEMNAVDFYLNSGFYIE